MNVVFMGTPDFAVGSLKALLKAGYQITGVVTQPDKPKGRKKEPTAGPVKEEALSCGLFVYQPWRIRDAEAIEAIRAMQPDLIVVAAFGQIIPKEILDMPQYGCINVHASLLPAYRGAAPIQRAILDGCEKTGVSIMRMNEGLDTGDIISIEETAIGKEETGGSLFDRLAKLGAELLIKTIPEIVSGEATYQPQPNDSTTSYAKMIRKEDGRIDWTQDAAVIERQIRALNPWPSAYTALDQKMLKVWKASVAGEDMPKDGAEAGRIVAQDQKSLRVQTGRGILVLEEVQLAGKKRMKAEDFLRGYKIQNTKLGE